MNSLNPNTSLKRTIKLASIFLAGVLQASGTDVAHYVDPSIGNVSKLLRPTHPTFHLPNQMIRMYPIRSGHLDDQITGFPFQVTKHQRPGIMRLSAFTGDLEESV